MIFTETKLPGALLIEPEKLEDDRGFFARSWCCREFEANGLNPRLVQCDISFSHNKGTLRGMHYQVAPFSEVKLVRCTRGSIYDAIIDLRPDSPTFKDHMGVILSAENHKMLYVPEGFAHGFVTLEDSTEVVYQMSEFYAPEHGRGVRWNDRTFEICWPISPNAHPKRFAMSSRLSNRFNSQSIASSLTWLWNTANHAINTALPELRPIF